MSGVQEDEGRRRRPPYATTGQIEALFERIGTLGDPGTVDTAWVENYHLAPTQPEAVVSLLKWLGVVDAKGKSLGNWDDLRIPAKRQAKLDELVRNSYKEIFDLVDVSQATRADLEGSFIQAYSSGDPRRPVVCFIGLCRRAGIPMIAQVRSGGDGSRHEGPPGKGARREQATAKRVNKPSERPVVQLQGVSITLNIQIPPDWSEEQIQERLRAILRVTSESLEE